MTKTTAVIALIHSVLFVLLGCEEEKDNSDNLLESSEQSQCLAKQDGATSSTPNVTGYNPEDYRGVECVAWEALSDGRLAIDLFSHEMNCAGYERVTANPAGPGVVQLHLELPDILAGCMCCFDFGFILKNVDTTANLELVLAYTSEEWEEQGGFVAESVRLPLAKRESGILCRYNPADATDCPTSDTFQYCDNDNPCSVGRECTEVSSEVYTAVCMEPCESNSECDSDLFSCQEGSCRLAETW